MTNTSRTRTHTQHTHPLAQVLKLHKVLHKESNHFDSEGGVLGDEIVRIR